MERGRELEKEAIVPFQPAEVSYDKADLAAGADTTLELMRRGVPAIYQPVFVATDGGFQFVAKPDLIVWIEDGARERVGGLTDSGLLVAAEGPAAAGVGPYRVVEIKHSRRVTAAHLLQLMFSAALLNRVQGRRVEEHQLLLAGRHTETFRLADFEAWVTHVVDDAKAVMSAAEPPPFTAKRMCRECEWRRACFERARRDDLPGRIFGLTPRELDALERAGLRRVSAIAAGAEALACLEEIPEDRRALFGARAAVLLSHQSRPVRPVPLPARPFLLHLVTDHLESKELAAAAGGFPGGPAIVITGTADEVRTRLAEVLSADVPLRDVVTTTEQALELLRDEVIFPLMGPADPRIVADIPHLTSLEGIATRALALDLEIYDFEGLCRHFRIERNEEAEPEWVLAERGPGDHLAPAFETLLGTAARLYGALARMAGGARG